MLTEGFYLLFKTKLCNYYQCEEDKNQKLNNKYMYFMLCVTVNSFNVVDNVEITLSVNEWILLELRM